MRLRVGIINNMILATQVFVPWVPLEQDVQDVLFSFGHVGYFQGKVVAQYVVRYIYGRVKHYGVTGSASAGQPWVISTF